MKGQKETNIGRRKYDEDFKRSALKMIQNAQSVRSVAQALGVAEGQLHKWKRAFKQTGLESEKEVAELRLKLRQVEIERDILKKALAISAGRFDARRVSSLKRNQLTIQSRPDAKHSALIGVLITGSSNQSRRKMKMSL